LVSLAHPARCLDSFFANLFGFLVDDPHKTKKPRGEQKHGEVNDKNKI
jgi:hypothetical protein